MTGKQRAMVAERLKDKTAHNYEITKRAGYKAKSKHTLAQQYLENMNKPEIRTLLDNVAEEMESTLISDVRQYRDSEKLGERTLANDTARWIHDKVKGKAKHTVDVNTTSVMLSIDLTNSTSD